MLKKMDQLTKSDPPFHVTLGEVGKGTESDCVKTTEQILAAGGIKDNSTTPTGLWDDTYDTYSSEDSPTDSEAIKSPQRGKFYMGDSEQDFRRLRDLVNSFDYAAEQEEERKRQEQGVPGP
jgi:hypothetical protein